MEISGMMCLTCWEWLDQGIDVFLILPELGDAAHKQSYHITISAWRWCMWKKRCFCRLSLWILAGETSTLWPTANISFSIPSWDVSPHDPSLEASPRISQREGSSVSTPLGEPSVHGQPPRCDVLLRQFLNGDGWHFSNPGTVAHLVRISYLVLCEKLGGTVKSSKPSRIWEGWFDDWIFPLNNFLVLLDFHVKKWVGELMSWSFLSFFGMSFCQ